MKLVAVGIGVVGCKLASHIGAEVLRMLAGFIRARELRILVDRKLNLDRLANRRYPELAAVVAGLIVFGCLDRRNYSCSSFYFKIIINFYRL